MMGDVKLEGGLRTFRVSYFQGPRDVLCLVLAVSDPGEKTLSIFNTDTFKPPANPEDWKYGSPADLDKLPDAKAKAAQARAIIKVRCVLTFFYPSPQRFFSV